MHNKGKLYKTKQKEQILNYLKNADSYVTAQQVFTEFQKKKNPIGLSTIYRYLEKLASFGIVKKYSLIGVKGACFEYFKNREPKIYFKCEHCFKITELNCNKLANIHEHLLEEHNIKLDLFKTVYYGSCEKCSQNI